MIVKKSRFTFQNQSLLSGNICYTHALEDTSALLLFRPNLICKNNAFEKDSLLDALKFHFHDKKRNNQLALSYKDLTTRTKSSKTWNEVESQEYFCKSMIETDIAVVTVQIDSPVMTTYIKARRTSFAEQLANLGKAHNKDNILHCNMLFTLF